MIMQRMSSRWLMVLAVVAAVALGAHAQRASFAHGVASGDPYSDSIVLWSRVTPAAAAPVEVTWTISEAADMSAVTLTGQKAATLSGDYTVKVIPQGLTPATIYYYQVRGSYATGGYMYTDGHVTRVLS